MNANYKTAVLSDIHFGVKECTIGIAVDSHKTRKKENTKEDFVNKFVKHLLNEQIESIILLGDIFDIHLSNLETAIKKSSYFFQRLKTVKTLKEIIYIPGNHDHLLWFLHVFERHVIGQLKSDSGFTRKGGDFNVCSDIEKGYNVFVNNDSFLKNVFLPGQSEPNLEVTVLYPFFKKKIGNSKYFFTHGHFFDKQQTIFYSLIKKLFPFAAHVLRLDSSKINNANIDELELYCSPLYNMFSMFGHTVDGRERMENIYKQVKDFEWAKSPDLDDKALRTRIKDFVILYGGQEGANKYYKVMDYLVFGHTHHADINMYFYPENKGLKIINTGCWISSDKIGSFLIIDPNDKYPKLMSMTKEGIYEHESSEDMRKGNRPKNKRRFYQN